MSGAALVRHALEQLPIRFTFGIPGVHNTEIYDELNRSDKIRPILVTHEGSAAFMADGVSRTSPGEIGCLVIVPAAGLTHALSGIAEAFLDGIPLLVVSGGIRNDIRFGYQLHEIDQLQIVAGVTKFARRISRQQDVVSTIFEAYEAATTGVPGPAFVEVPVNTQLFLGDPGDVFAFVPVSASEDVDEELIGRAAEILASAKKPGIFVGWGAVDVIPETQQIAELLGAPVSTTLQGMSAFRGDHPLHAGMGFSKAAVPSATKAFEGVDALLAVGTRFAEIPTGSFGCEVPENLIHIDIDPQVINRNYPAAVGIVADSRVAIPRLSARLRAMNLDCETRRQVTERQIAENKTSYRREWYEHARKQSASRVNPALFFDHLRDQLDDNAIVTVDDGNHTFLAAELFESRGPRQFISPTDFNCMGYCVPAAIGAKLSNPDRQVVGIVGDGAFLMTALESLTATTEKAGVVYFVFHDGELAQISQGQEIPYNQKTATILGEIHIEGIATAVGAAYAAIECDDDIDRGIQHALDISSTGRPVIVDVKIDYTKRTRFTEGVVQTVLSRFPLGDRFRFVGRAVWRKLKR
jgi:acetolactate synthase-1/2/3 large subunit